MTGETLMDVADGVEVKRALAMSLRMADMDYISARNTVTADFLEGKSEGELLFLLDAEGDVVGRTHQAFAFSEFESVQRRVLGFLAEKNSPFVALALTRSEFPDIRNCAWEKVHRITGDREWFLGFLRELLA